MWQGRQKDIWVSRRSQKRGKAVDVERLLEKKQGTNEVAEGNTFPWTLKRSMKSLM